MATRSRKQTLLRVTLAVLALIIVALVLVPVVVPADRWKQIAFDRLQAQTGLVATAESAGASLFPLGLKLSGLEVRDPQERPEWSGLDLELDQVVVRARLRPLFSGRFEVDQIELVRPRVELTPVERPNPAPGTPGATGSQSSGESPGRSLSIALASLSIQDGTVVVNQPDGTRLALHGLSNVSSLSIEGAEGEGSASGTLDSLVLDPPDQVAVSVHGLAWKLEADFAADGTAGAARIETISVAGLTAGGQASWRLEDVPVVDAELRFEADVEALSREWFEPRRDSIPWPEGIDPSDFGDFTGRVAGVMKWSGPADAEASPEELASHFELTASIESIRGRLLGRDDLATLDADLSFASGELQLQPMRIATPPGELRGSYRARPLASTDARLDLEGTLDASKARELAASLWPRFEPMIPEGSTGPKEWPGVAGQVALVVGADLPADPEAEPRLTWSAQTTSMRVRPVDVDAEFELADVRLTGDATSASWEQGNVRGPGLDLTPRIDVVLAGETSRVTGRIDAGRIDLDALQEALAPAGETAMGNWLVGVAHAQANAEMWVPPADLSADLDLRAEEVLASGHRLESVTGKAALAERRVSVREVEAALGSGRVTAVADVDYNQTPPVWTTEVQARAVPASVLLAPDVPKLAGALDTELSGDFEFSGALTVDPAAALQMLSGDLSFDAAAGLLRTEPVIGSQISQFVGQYAPKWKELAFKALDAELTVEDGEVIFDRFLISGETEVRVDGQVGLDGRCDYRLDVVLPASATPDLGALQPAVDLLRAEDGRFPFAVKVTGPAAKPQVGIDFDALRQRAEERGRDELEDKVGDAVKGLFDKLKGKNRP